MPIKVNTRINRDKLSPSAFFHPSGQPLAELLSNCRLNGRTSEEEEEEASLPFSLSFPQLPSFLSRGAAAVAAAARSRTPTASGAANGRSSGEFPADVAEAAATRLVGAEVTAEAAAALAALQQVP